MNGGLVLIFNNIQEINFQLSFFFAFSFPFEIGSLVAGICKEQKKHIHWFQPINSAVNLTSYSRFVNIKQIRSISTMRQIFWKIKSSKFTFRISLNIKVKSCFLSLSIELQLSFNTQTMDAQRSLFSSKSQTFGLGQTICADLGHLGVFSADLSAPILTNLVFSKRATKIDEIFTVDLTLTT